MAVSLLYLMILISWSYAKLPEEGLNVTELIEFWGYPTESHEVCTDDGYYLTLHRIPYGRLNKSASSSLEDIQRPVMFLQHGLLCSSANWLVNGPSNSLGYILADAGYDVWMGNMRGNTHSKKHMFHSINSTEFWDFSFDEMCAYDLPAMIDYVLETTGQKQLYYVGHSQGTLVVFAGASQNKGLMEKIKLFFALAPVARIANLQSPIGLFSGFIYDVEYFSEKFQILEFLPVSKYIDFLSRHICTFLGEFCAYLISLIAGYDKHNLNITRLPIYLKTTPAGTSMKNIYHFGQLVNSKKFQKYDYGWLGNLIWYWSFHPPVYPMKAMTTPVVLISGSEDWLSTPKDVEWTSKQLPNVLSEIKILGYNHLDFIWGMHSGKDIYEKILKIAETYKSH